MSRRPSSQPNEVELEILRALWRRGPSTVREVHEALKAERGGNAPSPLKMMHVMTAKGMLERDDAHRPVRYRASAPAEQTQLSMLDYLLQKAFGGSARNMLVRAVSAERVSADDLAEMLKLVRDAKRAGAGRGHRPGRDRDGGRAGDGEAGGGTDGGGSGAGGGGRS